MEDLDDDEVAFLGQNRCAEGKRLWTMISGSKLAGGQSRTSRRALDGAGFLRPHQYSAPYATPQ